MRLYGKNKITVFIQIFIGLAILFYGLSQFVVVGHYLGKSYEAVVVIAQQYLLLLIFVFTLMFLLFSYMRRLSHKFNFTLPNATRHYFKKIRSGDTKVVRQTILRIVAVLAVALVLYAITLLVIFFVGIQKLNGAIPPDLQHSFTSLEQIVQAIDSTTYYKNGTQDIGPINVVVISTVPLVEILRAAQWVETETFVRNDIGIFSYFENAEYGMFPISDLYFNDVPQNYAFQFGSSTLTTREHARAWNFGTYNGTPVYIMSASKDIGIDIYRNLSFAMPYHRVDLEVDASQIFLTEGIKNAYPTVQEKTVASTLGVREVDAEREVLYFTDGLIQILELK